MVRINGGKEKKNKKCCIKCVVEKYAYLYGVESGACVERKKRMMEEGER